MAAIICQFCMILSTLYVLLGNFTCTGKTSDKFRFDIIQVNQLRAGWATQSFLSRLPWMSSKHEIERTLMCQFLSEDSTYKGGNGPTLVNAHGDHSNESLMKSLIRLGVIPHCVILISSRRQTLTISSDMKLKPRSDTSAPYWHTTSSTKSLAIVSAC